MNILVKRGSLDNIVTYEHYCDEKKDLTKIPKEQTTLGSVAIVLRDEGNTMGVYIANSAKEWIPMLINGSGSSSGGASMHVCDVDEYNTTTLIPTVENPQENTFYLVPSSNGTNNVYDEWIWVSNDWEKIGGAAGGNDWTGNKTITGNLTVGGGSLTLGNTTINNEQLSRIINREPLILEVYHKTNEEEYGGRIIGYTITPEEISYALAHGKIILFECDYEWEFEGLESEIAAAFNNDEYIDFHLFGRIVGISTRTNPETGEPAFELIAEFPPLPQGFTWDWSDTAEVENVPTFIPVPAEETTIYRTSIKIAREK